MNEVVRSRSFQGKSKVAGIVARGDEPSVDDFFYDLLENGNQVDGPVTFENMRFFPLDFKMGQISTFSKRLDIVYGAPNTKNC